MRRKKWTPELQETLLRQIAEQAIQHGWDIVRTPLVRCVAGDSFYNRFAKGEQNMHALLERIRNLDPKRYGHLSYVPVRSNRGRPRRLDPAERQIIPEHG